MLSCCVLLVGLLVTGCGSSEKGFSPGYYRGIVVQPNGDFIGFDPISNEKAKTGSAFYVEFNDQKKLSKVEYRRGDKPADTNWRYTDIPTENNRFSSIAVSYQEGYVRYTFKDAKGNPTAGFFAAHSLRYRLGEKGEKTAVFLYNKDNELFNCQLGFSQMTFAYDDSKRVAKYWFYGVSGERVATTSGYYEFRLKYKEKNNRPVEVANYGKDGEIKPANNGIAKTVYTYDENGRLIETRFYGSDDNLREIGEDFVSLELGLGGAIRKVKRDANGYVTEVRFFGKDEQPIGLKKYNGVATVKNKYDDNGYLLETMNYGLDDQPRARYSYMKNFVGHKWKYDEYGNVAETRSIGADGSLVAIDNKNAAAIYRWKYDAKRLLTEGAAFGINDDPVNFNYEKYHRFQQDWNDDGRLTEVRFYDKNGQLVKPGRAIIRYFYRNDGTRTRTEYLDANNKVISSF